MPAPGTSGKMPVSKKTVTGAGIYYTAYYFIQGENALSLANGISTFKVAVALAVGIALVLGLPMPSGHAWKRK